MDQYKQTAATVMPPNVSGNPCLNSLTTTGSTSSSVKPTNTDLKVHTPYIRNIFDVVANRGTSPPSCPGTSREQTPTQDMSEAVFMTGNNPLHKPDKSENVVKKESCRKKLDYPSNDSTKKHEDDYQKNRTNANQYRTNANQHRNKAKAFFKKADSAKASGKLGAAKYFLKLVGNEESDRKGPIFKCY